MRTVKMIVTVILTLSLLASCGERIQKPLENENNIPDAEVAVRIGSRKGHYHNKMYAYADLRIRTDAYESCIITVESYGFMFWHDRDYAKNRLEYEITRLNTDGRRYEITRDGAPSDAFTDHHSSFVMAAISDPPSEGYITVTYNVKDKYTGKEYSAKRYLYYAVEGEEIEWSTTSVYDARRNFDSEVVYIE